MSEVSSAYREARGNIAELAVGSADVVVPSCPEWTVRDLVAHLVDIAGVVIGRMADRPPAAAPDLDLTGLLDEWDRLGERVEGLVDERGGGDLMTMDAFTHELDVRTALGVDFPEEHRAFWPTLEVLVSGFGGGVDEHRLPGLRLSTEDRQWIVGDNPVGTLTADRYDLIRSVAGRRSHDQILALDWTTSGEQFLPAFGWGPFNPPAQPVEG